MLPADDHSLTGDDSLVVPEFDTPPADPMDLLSRWLDRARGKVSEPLAGVLATADEHGHPSSRVLRIKDVRADGLVFTTRSNSRKGHDLAVNPHASLSLHWRETVQQVTIAGHVVRLSDAESDALFARRSREARATSIVSVQGEELRREVGLVARAEAQLSDPELRRPAEWHGYLLSPERLEFWQGRTSRLHRRLEYVLTRDSWVHRRLQP